MLEHKSAYYEIIRYRHHFGTPATVLFFKYFESRIPVSSYIQHVQCEPQPNKRSCPARNKMTRITIPQPPHMPSPNPLLFITPTTNRHRRCQPWFGDSPTLACATAREPPAGRPSSESATGCASWPTTTRKRQLLRCGSGRMTACRLRRSTGTRYEWWPRPSSTCCFRGTSRTRCARERGSVMRCHTCSFLSLFLSWLPHVGSGLWKLTSCMRVRCT